LFLTFLYKHWNEQRESENSIQVAINEEIASYEELDGINIMTDARHGWRKNSKDTSVVALGEKTHKVMDCVQ
jgi:predicted GNAT family N-acyltransferase